MSAPRPRRPSRYAAHAPRASKIRSARPERFVTSKTATALDARSSSAIAAGFQLNAPRPSARPLRKRAQRIVSLCVCDRGPQLFAGVERRRLRSALNPDPRVSGVTPANKKPRALGPGRSVWRSNALLRSRRRRGRGLWRGRFAHARGWWWVWSHGAATHLHFKHA